MIRNAEERGDLKDHERLVEPTSGNTGVGLAMIALGYQRVKSVRGGIKAWGEAGFPTESAV